MVAKNYLENKHIHAQQFYDDLVKIVTVSEAADMTGYPMRYVRFWCDAGWLVARKAGGTWVISKPSLEHFIRVKLERKRRVRQP